MELCAFEVQWPSTALPFPSLPCAQASEVFTGPRCSFGEQLYGEAPRPQRGGRGGLHGALQIQGTQGNEVKNRAQYRSKQASS